MKSVEQHPELNDVLPDPDAIRSRILRLREEVSVLRRMLKLVQTGQRLAEKAKAERPVTDTR